MSQIQFYLIEPILLFVLEVGLANSLAFLSGTTCATAPNPMLPGRHMLSCAFPKLSCLCRWQE